MTGRGTVIGLARDGKSAYVSRKEGIVRRSGGLVWAGRTGRNWC